MTEKTPSENSTKKPDWIRLDRYELEADIAFFEAQIAFIRKYPVKLYQQAQMRTYSALKDQLSSVLTRVNAAERLKKNKTKDKSQDSD